MWNVEGRIGKVFCVSLSIHFLDFHVVRIFHFSDNYVQNKTKKCTESPVSFPLCNGNIQPRIM